MAQTVGEWHGGRGKAAATRSRRGKGDDRRERSGNKKTMRSGEQTQEQRLQRGNGAREKWRRGGSETEGNGEAARGGAQGKHN